MREALRTAPLPPAAEGEAIASLAPADVLSQERLAGELAAADTGAGEPVAGVEARPRAQDIAGLLARAQEVDLTEPETSRLAEGFRQLVLAGGRSAADALLQAIDAPALKRHRVEGISLRTLATEALVDLGHPYALEVPPEAFEEARAQRQAAEARKEAPWFGYGLFTLGVLIPVGWYLALLPSNDALGEGAIPVALTAAMAAVPGILAGSRTSAIRRRLGMALTTALGAFGLWLGTMPLGPVWPLVASASALLLSVPFFAKRNKDR